MDEYRVVCSNERHGPHVWSMGRKRPKAIKVATTLTTQAEAARDSAAYRDCYPYTVQTRHVGDWEPITEGATSDDQ